MSNSLLESYSCITFMNGEIPLELNQLEYFLTIARLQHVTRAAEVLSISQPALSHSIARLEDEIGVPLFERNGRNIQLTRYGQVFAARVEDVLDQLQKGKQEIQELAHPDKGMINLAYLNILGAQVIPSIIGAFHKESPNVRFNLSQGTQSYNLQQLNAGLADLIITSPREELPGLAWMPLFSYTLSAALPSNHSLSGNKSISIKELASEPFIGLKTTCGLNKVIDTFIRMNNFTPNIVYEAEDLTTVAGFVSSGLGISLLPNMTSIMTGNIAWLPIEEPGCKSEVGLQWKKDRYLSPTSKQFGQYIARHFGRKEFCPID
jgi:DNA-binding transcriptional LysR family regulator